MTFSVHAESFFSANGDLGLEVGESLEDFLRERASSRRYSARFLKQSPLELMCRRIDCRILSQVFTALEEKVSERASDQDLINKLEVEYLLELGLSYKHHLSNRELGLILAAGQSLGLIDSVQYSLLSEAIETRKEETVSFLVFDYYQTFRMIKRWQLRPLEDSTYESLNETKLRTRVKALKNQTPRERLYRNFSSLQIRRMSQVIEDGLDAMNALHAEINIDYNNDGQWNRTEELSAQERYRLGLKLMVRDYHRLVNSSFFSNGPRPTLIDCLSASLEMGIIDKKILEEIIQIEALQIVPKSFWERHSNTFTTLFRVGALNVPVIGPYLVVAIILTEAFIEGRNGYESFSPDHLF